MAGCNGLQPALAKVRGDFMFEDAMRGQRDAEPPFIYLYGFATSRRRRGGSQLQTAICVCTIPLSTLQPYERTSFSTSSTRACCPWGP